MQNAIGKFLGVRTLTIILLLCLFAPRSGAGQAVYKVSGTVSSAEGAPLSHARLIVKGRAPGGLARDDGAYALRLPGGAEYTLECRYIGFEPASTTFVLRGDTTINFRLAESSLQTRDVVVTSDGRDPAYGIIRKAIEARKRNRDERLPRYTYDAYTRVRVELKEPPNIGAARYPDTSNMILYLAENFSNVSFEAPGRVQETITASRVSGDSEQYSFFGSMFLRFSLYRNLTPIEGLSERGFVSPLARNAFFFYDYRLTNTRQADGRKLYRVELLPKRENDPAFEGWVEIADSTWEVASFNLIIDQQRPLSGFADSLAVRQQGVWAADSAWRPAELSFHFRGGLAGARFGGYALSSLSDYRAVEAFAAKTFGREVMRVADTAAGRPDTFWRKRRPVQLDSLETRDYQVRDSLHAVLSSPEHLDSLTRRSLRPKLRNLFAPWRIRDYRNDWSLSISPLAKNLFYNTVEGAVFNLDAALALPPRRKSRWILEGGARYATSRDELRWRGAVVRQEGGGARGRFRFNKNFIRLDGGFYLSQLSPRTRQIPVVVNGYYSLLTQQNFLKLYHKTFVQLSAERQLANGLSGAFRADFEDRRPLDNAADRSWFKREGRSFSANPQFAAHQALVLDARMTWRPGNRYISTPDGRINLGSKWPLLRGQWRGGFAVGGAPGSRFHFLRLAAEKDLPLGLFGELEILSAAGGFLSNRQVYLPDFYHVKANQTFLAEPRPDEFNLMRYYQYSTRTEFFQAHFTHHFNGFIIRKLPLLRKLAWQWTAGADVLATRERGFYAEAAFGLENIAGFGVARAHFLAAGDGWARAAFTLGWSGGL